ncbi:asparaginase [Bifidobacterium tsurumiense]|uniref:asparaginase n=1 Tax=Bifidobacterium tsurumiense TaxID=356829 RepID=UPI0012B1D926|nr:asparaginase [Bifidobacterium tsurumiense]MDY4678654.1 asparaginase [Bifidobacterium tsurumiense]MSS13423.1 asparaginase [Bifidobacterium tsurumiense]
MRVHITYTGGTIGMVMSPQGLLPGADLQQWLYAILDNTHIDRDQVTLTQLDPLIDSAHATPASWQAIIEDVLANRHAADAFIVLHGTDTMSYSASALSFALTDFDKPVIFTGSQHPLGTVQSDAATNIAGALYAALSDNAQGVSLLFGQHLFAANRSTKSSSWAFEGFSAPATGPLATAGVPWRWHGKPSPALGWCEARPYELHDVMVIDMVPGLSAERMQSMLRPLPEAIIIRAYGVGNIPNSDPGVQKSLIDAMAHDVPVIIASQCPQADVIIDQYAASSAVVDAGAVGTGDMTLEAAYAKTIFLLSQGLRGMELAQWMNQSIAGEITTE